MQTDALVERYAIRCAQGNNGGEWEIHYTEDQKEFWRSFVRDLVNEIRKSQLPEGMEHCTIRFKECEKGHGRLTADNWIDHGCLWCRIDQIKEIVNG